MQAEQDRQLAKAAIEVRRFAHAPYSGFSVGAALVDDNGDLYTGCNVENASFPEGSCAETAAIAAMVAAGGRRIATIAVAGGRDAVMTCTPCGGCRQRIREFADDATRILVLDDDESWRAWTVAELLPASFRLEDS